MPNPRFLVSFMNFDPLSKSPNAEGVDQAVYCGGSFFYFLRPPPCLPKEISLFIADTSPYCSFMPAMSSVLVAISKILLSETLRLMQHAAMISSLKLGYGQASVVVMSQKTLFEIARALAMKMTGAGDEGGDDHHEDQQRTRARKTAHHTEWTQRRDAKLIEIQDHFYRLKAKLASSSALCKDSKEKEEFFERAEKVDSHILAAFQELTDVPDLPQSTVPNRYRSDPKRGQRPKTPPSKRAAVPHQDRNQGSQNSQKVVCHSARGEPLAAEGEFRYRMSIGTTPLNQGS